MDRICVLIMTLAIAAALVVADMVRTSFTNTQNISLDDLMKYKVSGEACIMRGGYFVFKVACRF